MSFFDAAQKALAAGRSVFYGELYNVGFVGGFGYYWDGFGPLNVGGQVYAGAGNLIARSEIPFGIDDEAGDLVITMSGVDATLVAAVRAEKISGRPIAIYGRFFDEALQLDPDTDSFLLFRGTMDVPTYGAGAFGTRSISIPCEGEWTDRGTARNAMFSDADQKRRFPGDRGLEYVYRYNVGVRRRWPKFDSARLDDLEERIAALEATP